MLNSPRETAFFCRLALYGLTAVAITAAPSLGQSAGIITTVAGSGAQAISGDGGPAIDAGMNPSGVVLDSHGNIFISDFINNVIRKVDPAGTITTVAGCGPSINCLIAGAGDGGPALKGNIETPYDVAVDSAGNLYMSDGGRNSVRKVDTNGIITTFAGGSTPSQFSGDGGPAIKAGLFGPTGLAFDNEGNLYIADLSNNRIRKVNTSGIISTVAGSNVMGYAGDGGPAISAALNNPHGVAVDGTGNIYIADTNNFVVRKVDSAGTITTFAGNGGVTGQGEGVPATTVALLSPWGLAVDGARNVYISEFAGYRVRKVDHFGIITTVAGTGGFPGFSGDGGPATSAKLSSLWGIRLDASGNIYIADNQNNRIRKVSPPHAAPSVNALGVVNNASFAAGSNPIAPGAIAAVFGTNLTDGSTVLFSSFGPDGKLATTLGGAQVSINGELVPIFYSTPAQLGIQIPTDLTGSSATIQVTVGGKTSAAQMVPIDPLSPGLFSTNQSGHGQGAILIANTNTLAAPKDSIPGRDTRPAKPGEFITIFCTGLGKVAPALATGVAAATNTTVAKPTVTIDGAGAAVQFSGMAPGFVGLYQVNVEVPPGTRSANDVPVVLTIGGKQSNTVTIAVSGV